MVQLLGSGKDLQLQVYVSCVQDEAGGIAQALLLAEQFAGNDLSPLFLRTIFSRFFKDAVSTFNGGAKLLLKVRDPEHFGVATLLAIPLPISPKNQNNRPAIGRLQAFMYDSQVFDIIRHKPSARGELEISDVNAAYLEKNAVGYAKLTGWWSDAGTFKSLANASRQITEQPIHE